MLTKVGSYPGTSLFLDLSAVRLVTLVTDPELTASVVVTSRFVHEDELDDLEISTGGSGYDGSGLYLAGEIGIVQDNTSYEITDPEPLVAAEAPQEEPPQDVTAPASGNEDDHPGFFERLGRGVEAVLGTIDSLGEDVEEGVTSLFSDLSEASMELDIRVPPGFPLSVVLSDGVCLRAQSAGKVLIVDISDGARMSLSSADVSSFKADITDAELVIGSLAAASSSIDVSETSTLTVRAGNAGQVTLEATDDAAVALFEVLSLDMEADADASVTVQSVTGGERAVVRVDMEDQSTLLIAGGVIALLALNISDEAVITVGATVDRAEVDVDDDARATIHEVTGGWEGDVSDPDRFSILNERTSGTGAL